jgi:hypothetical protein
MTALNQRRRSIFKAMLAAPLSLFTRQQGVPPRAVGIKVGAGPTVSATCGDCRAETSST